MSANNANTGVAHKVDDFQWYQPKSQPHVEAFLMSAPDTSIPPTLTSSYKNIHVVLDTVHPSTQTITRNFDNSGILHASSDRSVELPSFEFSLPKHNATWDLVGAEILSKNWRRQLKHLKPQDFSRSFKTWSPSQLDRLENEERQWRMSRPLDAIWAGRWHRVGLVFAKHIKPTTWAAWLRSLEKRLFDDAKDLLEFVYDVEQSFKDNLISDSAVVYPRAQLKLSYGPSEGAELIDFTFSRRVPRYILQLEEQERQWRMTRGVDAILSGKWSLIGKEIRYSIGPIGFAQWFANLKNRAAYKSADVLDTIGAVAAKGLDTLESAAFVAEDAAETAYDIGASVLPKLVRQGSDLVEGAYDTAKNVLGSAAVMGANAAVVGAHALGSAAVMGANAAVIGAHALGSAAVIGAHAVESAAVLGADAAIVGAHALGSAAVMGAHAVESAAVLGAHAVESAAVIGAHAVESAAVLGADAAIVGAHALGSLANSAKDSIDNMNVEAVEASTSVYPTRGFKTRYSAPIDFTFKAHRTPAYIIRLEEEERYWRLNRPINPVFLGLWRKVGLELLSKFSSGFYVSSLAYDAESVVESIADKAKGWSGFLGSIAHSVADTTSSIVSAAAHTRLVESAKDKFAEMYFPGSIPAINKAEELERSRRLTEKHDPMMMARLNRVQVELLHTVKSV